MVLAVLKKWSMGSIRERCSTKQESHDCVCCTLMQCVCSYSWVLQRTGGQKTHSNGIARALVLAHSMFCSTSSIAHSKYGNTLLCSRNAMHASQSRRCCVFTYWMIVVDSLALGVD